MNKFCFSLLLVLAFAACKNANQEKQSSGVTPQYYYYPKANVYFDSANKDYLFLGNDGKTWQTAKQIPAVVQALMDKSVFIQNPSDPVWKNNEQHKLVYSALLYATPNDTTAKKDTPIAINKSTIGSADSLSKKEHKGIRKIVDKFFGLFKKKKDSSK